MIRALIADALRVRRRKASLEGRPQEIAAYHRARAGTDVAAIPDRVWTDLELEAVFGVVDRCNCALGQQVLYDILRRPLTDPIAVSHRDTLIRAFSASPELREHVRRAVAGLRSSATYDLHVLATSQLPARPKWWPLLPALTLSAISAVVLLFIVPRTGLFLLLATLAINIVIQTYYRPRVHHLLRPIGALPSLLNAAQRLERITAPELSEHVAKLREHARGLQWTKSFSRHLLREHEGDPLTSVLTVYVNLVFLADVNAYVWTIDSVKRLQGEIEGAVRLIGTLDALSAVSEFRSALPAWCAPDLQVAPGSITGLGIYHPLVEKAVPNDLVVDGSMVVTGSNMGGKTTLLRAAGVCAVLGQTIATCPARHWTAACMRVETLIARSDDLQRGKSYFLVEAELVKQLLESAAGEVPHLFIIDELYRGTNTLERVAAARAVLEQLNSGKHICIVSTHDLELVPLLRGDWTFRHFQESLDEKGMHFDFLIREGTASAGNALKLLQLTGYPADVMTNANETFEALRRNVD